MSEIDILILEITVDREVRGYAGMTDEEVAVDMNLLVRVVPVDSVDPADVYDAMDLAEYDALSDIEQAQLSDIFSLPEVRIQGNTRTRLLAIFGAGTSTRGNLIKLATRTISRAAELGLAVMNPGLVKEARR